jgi:hypothetical protein
MKFPGLRAFLFLAIPLAEAAGPGDFDLRSSLYLTTVGTARLREYARTNEVAAAYAVAVARDTDALAAKAATALAVIRYEGLLHTDARRIADVGILGNLDDTAALLRRWQLTGDATSTEALRRHVDAWAERYVPTGNDVNENKLTPVLIAALSLRDAKQLGNAQAVDAWMRRMGELHFRAARKGGERGNRQAKRIRLLALFAVWSGEPDWREAARAGFRDFVDRSLKSDGGSYDLDQRDSLGYHCSALASGLELLHTLGDEGAGLYTWESPSGASLRKSVHFVLPYALGEKQREDWRHSKDGLDRERAASGLAEYQPGRPYDPQQALPMLELALFFDPAARVAVERLRARAPTEDARWFSLLSEAGLKP